MKFVYPEIHSVFDTKTDRIQTIVIENPELMYRILNDINSQIEGGFGKCVVSADGSTMNFEKNVELITQFVPFTINRKKLVNQSISALEMYINEGELYGEALDCLSNLEEIFLKATLSFKGDIIFSKINISSMIKASGLEFREEYGSLAEKVIDYIELVTEYDREKLFILYNFHSVVSDQEIDLFFDTALRHGYNILMLESSEYTLSPIERRYIVDNSLCEIC